MSGEVFGRITMVSVTRSLPLITQFRRKATEPVTDLVDLCASRPRKICGLTGNASRTSAVTDKACYLLMTLRSQSIPVYRSVALTPNIEQD